MSTIILEQMKMVIEYKSILLKSQQKFSQDDKFSHAVSLVLMKAFVDQCKIKLGEPVCFHYIQRCVKQNKQSKDCKLTAIMQQIKSDLTTDPIMNVHLVIRAYMANLMVVQLLTDLSIPQQLTAEYFDNGAIMMTSSSRQYIRQFLSIMQEIEFDIVPKPPAEPINLALMRDELRQERQRIESEMLDYQASGQQDEESEQSDHEEQNVVELGLLDGIVLDEVRIPQEPMDFLSAQKDTAEQQSKPEEVVLQQPINVQSFNENGETDKQNDNKHIQDKINDEQDIKIEKPIQTVIPESVSEEKSIDEEKIQEKQQIQQRSTSDNPIIQVTEPEIVVPANQEQFPIQIAAVQQNKVNLIQVLKSEEPDQDDKQWSDQLPNIHQETNQMFDDSAKISTHIEIQHFDKLMQADEKVPKSNSVVHLDELEKQYEIEQVPIPSQKASKRQLIEMSGSDVAVIMARNDTDTETTSSTKKEVQQVVIDETNGSSEELNVVSAKQEMKVKPKPKPCAFSLNVELLSADCCWTDELLKNRTQQKTNMTLQTHFKQTSQLHQAITYQQHMEPFTDDYFRASSKILENVITFEKQQKILKVWGSKPLQESRLEAIQLIQQLQQVPEAALSTDELVFFSHDSLTLSVPSALRNVVLRYFSPSLDSAHQIDEQCNRCAGCESDLSEAWLCQYSNKYYCEKCESSTMRLAGGIFQGQLAPCKISTQYVECAYKDYNQPLVLYERLQHSAGLISVNKLRRLILLSYYRLRQCNQVYCSTSLQQLQMNKVKIDHVTMMLGVDPTEIKVVESQILKNQVNLSPILLLGRREHIGCLEQAVLSHTGKQIIVHSTGYYSFRDVYEAGEGILQEILLNCLAELRKHASQCLKCGAAQKCSCQKMITCFDADVWSCGTCGNLAHNKCTKVCLQCGSK